MTERIPGRTWGLVRESVNLALHAVPERIDSEAVEAYLLGLPGVTAVHDVHIWAMMRAALVCPVDPSALRRSVRLGRTVIRCSARDRHRN